MIYWVNICIWVIVFLAGRGMNLWMVKTHGGLMPLSFPLGDWIPAFGQWVYSIGDVLQVFGLIAIILTTLIRFFDERYARA